ncbi:hypothetical protein HYALB_00000797 [Hymenoscyphus albidus]|uniref:Uncharacterized protein n=1 Tax=Hymenoscyphus albidus TaxID=595503 RepID=A0A9N9LQR6_9HELO|nr:hypothetical protein HYALB_00000797 [Hymenoscyphus albidus]
MSTTVRPSEVNNGITTSWLPLTTPGVSAPPECSSEIYRVPGGQDIVAFDPFYAKNIPNALQCLPLEVSKSWEQTGVTTVTSLGGFNCPSLYTKAATASLNKISAIVACCPSLYNYRSDNKCIFKVPAGQTVVVKNMSGNNVVRQENTNGGAITVTGFLISGYSFADDPARITTTITPIPVPAIPTSNPEVSALASINSIPTNSLPGSVPQIPSALAISTATPPTPSATSTTSSSGLSVGAKAGITISVVLTVIIIIVLLASLHIKRRRRTHPLYRDSHHPETGILEISREPRSIKNNVASKTKHQSFTPLSPTTQYPGSDGLQTVLSPEIHEQRAREMRTRAQTEKHPGKRIHVNSVNSIGPHEMDTHATVKFEMDAGSVKRPDNTKASTKPQTHTRSKTPSSSSSPTIPTSTFTTSPTPHSHSHSQTTSANTLRSAPLSPVSRTKSPDLIYQNPRELHTPVSSFGRNTPTIPNRTVSRNTSLNEELRNARSGSVGDRRVGRRTPDVLGRDGYGRERDGRERDVRLKAGGWISPVSTAERSFLDLSDLDD